MRSSVLVPSLIFVLAASPFLAAQNVTGAIGGVIRDASGAIVPGAAVTATNSGTGAAFRSVSGDTGVYSIAGIPVGVYDLRCELSGFQTYEAKAIRVQVNEVSRVDIGLKLGAPTETVTVNSEVVAVDTSSATLKVVVDQRRIEDLPLNGRNPTQLMQLVAGVEVDSRTS